MSEFAPVTDFLTPDPACPPVRPETMLVAVMHYNRGTHLRVLMDSIERHLPGASVLVMDDGSTDPATVDLLQTLAGRHTVLVNRGDNTSVYLRGLHANMNAVLEYAGQRNIPYVFFVQDDQQFVRPLDGRFFDEITALFRGCAVLSQVVPMFFKGFYTHKSLDERFGADAERGFYYERRPNYGICDIGITSVERLARFSFRFRHDEGGSARYAAGLGLRIVFNRNPVLMYMPWPRTERELPADIESLAVGVNPYADMTDDEIEALCSRPIVAFPVAESHLRTLQEVKRPWWYTVVNSHTISEYNDFLLQKIECGEI